MSDSQDKKKFITNFTKIQDQKHMKKTRNQQPYSTMFNYNDGGQGSFDMSLNGMNIGYDQYKKMSSDLQFSVKINNSSIYRPFKSRILNKKRSSSSQKQDNLIDTRHKKLQNVQLFYSTLRGGTAPQQPLNNQDIEHVVSNSIKAQDLHRQLQSNTKLNGDTLKYHMIRKILEQKDAREVYAISKLQKQNNNNQSSEGSLTDSEGADSIVKIDKSKLIKGSFDSLSNDDMSSHRHTVGSTKNKQGTAQQFYISVNNNNNPYSRNIPSRNGSYYRTQTNQGMAHSVYGDLTEDGGEFAIYTKKLSLNSRLRQQSVLKQSLNDTQQRLLLQNHKHDHHACNRFVQKSIKHQRTVIEQQKSRERQDMFYQGTRQNIVHRDGSLGKVEDLNYSLDTDEKSQSFIKDGKVSQIMKDNVRITQRQSQDIMKLDSNNMSKDHLLDQSKSSFEDMVNSQSRLKQEVRNEYSDSAFHKYNNNLIIGKSPSKNYKRRGYDNPILTHGNTMNRQSMNEQGLYKEQFSNDELRNMNRQNLYEAVERSKSMKPATAPMMPMFLPNLEKHKKYYVSNQQQIVGNNLISNMKQIRDRNNQDSQFKNSDNNKQLALKFERIAFFINRNTKPVITDSELEPPSKQVAQNKFYTTLEKMMKSNKQRADQVQTTKLMTQTKEEMEQSPLLQLNNKQSQSFTNKSPFTVVKSALNLHSQLQLSKLFTQMATLDSIQVPTFKQNCLIEYLKATVYPDLLSQMKSFSFFCQFQKQINSYTVVFYGEDTPVSMCCKQLTCFQFCKDYGSLKVICLDPLCQFNPLEQRQLNLQFISCIFDTPDSINQHLMENLNQELSDPHQNIKIVYQMDGDSDQYQYKMRRAVYNRSRQFIEEFEREVFQKAVDDIKDQERTSQSLKMLQHKKESIESVQTLELPQQ